MQTAYATTSEFPLVERFKAFYENVEPQSLDTLCELYEPNLVFTDPVHAITGLDALQAYFEKAFSGVAYCRFEFHSALVVQSQASFEWTMHYAHPKISQGKNIDVRGASVIAFGEKIYSHQDYYDMGQMLYEQVPVLGHIVKSLKARVG